MLKHVWEAAGFIPLASRGDVEVWVWKKVSTSALEHWKDQNKRELRREVILRTFLHFHLQGPSYTEYKHLWLCETCWFILCSLVSTTGEEKKKKKMLVECLPCVLVKAQCQCFRSLHFVWGLKAVTERSAIQQESLTYCGPGWREMGGGSKAAEDFEWNMLTLILLIY